MNETNTENLKEYLLTLNEINRMREYKLRLDAFHNNNLI